MSQSRSAWSAWIESINMDPIQCYWMSRSVWSAWIERLSRALTLKEKTCRAPHGARGLKDLSAALRQCLCLVALRMERAGWSIEANLGEKVKPICALRVYGEEIMSVI